MYVETASGTSPLHIDDFTMSYIPPSPIQTDIPSLSNVLAADFPIGAAIALPQTLGERARLLTKHFNQVTPGNALKWDATEPTEGAFRYTDADALVAFAKANNLRVRGHTFVWHNQTPAWVFTDANGQPMTATAANKTLLLTRLENHIRAVGTRYANDIYAWDVVNEVIDENQADGLRRSTWFNIAGLDYIRTAFRVARQVAPNAKLYINDYNTNVPAKRDKLFTLVQQLRAEGVPIDGVGHQMHSNVDWPTGADTDAMIAKFIPLGVLQEITEMDVSIYTNNGETFPTPPADRLTRQAARYKALFDVYRKYRANLASVTLWGIADDDTWLDTFPVNRKDAPLLFDVSLQAKPAYWSIVGTTSSTPGTTTTTTTTTRRGRRRPPRPRRRDADDHDDDHHLTSADDHHAAAGGRLRGDVPGGRHVAGWLPGRGHRAGRLGRSQRLDGALDQPDRAGGHPALGWPAHGQRPGVHRGRDVMERHRAPQRHGGVRLPSLPRHRPHPPVPHDLTCT